MRGGRGRDLIQGSKGPDHLIGHQQHDLLRGGAGNDILRGKSGHDTLHGGKGNDSMRGDSGSDRFRLSTGNDTIEDFSITQGDVIEAPNNLNLRLIQQGDHLLLKDFDNNIKTKLLNINSDDLLAHQPDLI